MATIDELQHSTGDNAPVTCQQQQGSVEVLRRAAALQQDPPDQRCTGITGEKISIHISGDIARGLSVDP